MQLTPIASNMTEVETSKARVLFSYRTPVAAYVFGRGYVKTEKWYSVTTTRHINKWMDMDMPVTGTVAVTPEKVEQTYLDNLVQGVYNKTMGFNKPDLPLKNCIWLYVFVMILFLL